MSCEVMIYLAMTRPMLHRLGATGAFQTAPSTAVARRASLTADAGSEVHWPYGRRWQPPLRKDNPDQHRGAWPGALAAELRLCNCRISDKIAGQIRAGTHCRYSSQHFI